jgi:hypothetical protein
VRLLLGIGVLAAALAIPAVAAAPPDLIVFARTIVDHQEVFIDSFGRLGAEEADSEGHA